MSAAAIIAAGIALIYLVVLDVHLTRRCDALADALEVAGENLDRAVVRVSHLEDVIPASVSPVGPFTRPIRIPVTPSGAMAARKATDTVEAHAVAGATASRILDADRYGRHAHRMPR